MSSYSMGVALEEYRVSASRSRHIGGGFNKATLAGLTIIGVLLVGAAIALDASKILNNWPVTANVVAGILSLPAIAVVTFLVIGRTLRSDEERRLARGLYFAGRHIEIRTRGLRISMYRAYLGRDPRAEGVLDVTVARDWDQLSAHLGAETVSEDILASLRLVSSSDVMEIKSRSEVLVQQMLRFQNMLDTIPDGPILAFMMAGSVDRFQYHLANYGAIADESENALTLPVEPLQRKKEMDELACLLVKGVEISNKAMEIAQATAWRFRYPYFEEDRIPQDEAKRQIDELLTAARYKWEDEQKVMRENSGAPG